MATAQARASRKKYTIELTTSANGKLGPTTVLVRDRQGAVCFTDSANLVGAVERDKMARRIAAKLKLGPEKVAEELEDKWNQNVASYHQAQAAAEAATAAARAAAAGPQAPANPLASAPQEVIEEAERLLNDPLLISRVADDVETLGVAGERELTTTIYLVGVSRLLPRPLSAIVQGPTSSGKSYLVEKTAELFPPEAVIHATQMTPQALFHMPDGSLKHKWIVAGERSRREDDDQAEATRALREMQSSGRLVKMMPVKGQGGVIETKQIVQEGPIAFIESTSLAKVFDEDENRSIMLHTDERTEQTRRIIARAAESGKSPGLRDTDRPVQVHHAIQRMLLPFQVSIPFADKLAELFSTKRVEARRAFSHLLNLVRACALLHQRQRVTDGNSNLVAEPIDYQIAAHLLAAPLGRLLGGAVSAPALRFYDQIKEHWPYRGDGAVTGCFTVIEAVRKVESNETSVRGWLRELRDKGAVEQVQEGRGQKAATWQLTETPPGGLGSVLPSVSEVCGSPGTRGRADNTQTVTP
jgi:hypothetical protein